MNNDRTIQSLVYAMIVFNSFFAAAIGVVATRCVFICFGVNVCTRRLVYLFLNVCVYIYIYSKRYENKFTTRMWAVWRVGGDARQELFERKKIFLLFHLGNLDSGAFRRLTDRAKKKSEEKNFQWREWRLTFINFFGVYQTRFFATFFFL